jgi:hypothetical protein
MRKDQALAIYYVQVQRPRTYKRVEKYDFFLSTRKEFEARGEIHKTF